jgi:uncharacterized membrane protein YesL
MRDALRVLSTTVKLLWDELVLLIQLNLAVSLLGVLALLSAAVRADVGSAWRLGLAAALLLPLPPSLGALSFVTNQIARGKAVGWDTFLHGLRRYWIKSYALVLLAALGLALILFNLWFYTSLLDGAWAPTLRLPWILLLVLWIAVQLFWFPMLLELESESILQSLKDAVLLTVLTPLFTLLLVLVAAVLLGLSLVLVLPFIFFSLALLTLLGNVATRDRLAYVQRKRNPHSH